MVLQKSIEVGYGMVTLLLINLSYWWFIPYFNYPSQIFNHGNLIPSIIHLPQQQQYKWRESITCHHPLGKMKATPPPQRNQFPDLDLHCQPFEQKVHSVAAGLHFNQTSWKRFEMGHIALAIIQLQFIIFKPQSLYTLTNCYCVIPIIYYQ